MTVSFGVQCWEPHALNTHWLTKMTETLNLSFEPSQFAYSLKDLEHNEILQEQLRLQKEAESIEDVRTQGSYFMNHFAWRLSAIVAAYDLSSFNIATLLSTLGWQSRVVREQHDGEWYRYVDYRFCSVVPAKTAKQLTAQEMADVLFQTFQPIITQLKLHSKLSSNALWSLVTDAIAVVYLNVGRELGVEPVARERIKTILAFAEKPLNNKRWHFKEYSVPAEQSPTGHPLKQWFRVRGGCCRYYTLENGAYCTTCIHVQESEREQRLKDFLISNAINAKK